MSHYQDLKKVFSEAGFNVFETEVVYDKDSPETHYSLHVIHSPEKGKTNSTGFYFNQDEELLSFITMTSTRPSSK